MESYSLTVLLCWASAWQIRDFRFYFFPCLTMDTSHRPILSGPYPTCPQVQQDVIKYSKMWLKMLTMWILGPHSNRQRPHQLTDVTWPSRDRISRDVVKVTSTWAHEKETCPDNILLSSGIEAYTQWIMDWWTVVVGRLKLQGISGKNYLS